MIKKLSLLICLIMAMFSPERILAQDFGHIVGGLVGNAIRIANAQDSWRRLPSQMTQCVDISLHMRGNNLQNVINAGMPPNDYRLSPLINMCRGFANELNSAVPCTVDSGTGTMVPSTCREIYVENGSNRALSFNEAVEFANNGMRFSIARIETTEAIKRRELAAKAEADRAEKMRLQAQAETERLRAQSKAAWDNIPAEQFNCLTQGLSQTPLSPQRAIDSGIMPSDPRFDIYKTACTQIAMAMQNQGTAPCERLNRLQNNVPTQCQWAWHIKQAGNEDSLSTDEAIHLWINALVNHQSINVEYGLVEPKEIRASRLLAEEDMRLQNLRQRDANITTERAQCKTPSGRWFHIFGPKAEDIIRSINNISTPLADVLKSSLAFLKDQPDDQLVRANLGQRIDYEAQKFSQQNFSSETEFEQKFNAALNELKQLNEQCLFELSDGFVVKVAQKHAIEAFDNAAQLKPSQQPHILFMAEQLSKLPSRFYSH